jgi:hypothetical protein
MHRIFSVALASACVLFGLPSPSRADIVVIPASEDTAPYSFIPSLARYNNPTLYAFQGFDENSTPHDFETYLRFDVTQANLPAGHVLTQATLLVTYAFGSSDYGVPSTDPGELDCREVLEPWSQTTLTWANRPDVDLPFDTITEIDSFGALLCDATDAVHGWITAQYPNHGIALTNTTERVIGMHSLESSADPSLKPQLILRTEVPEPGIAAALGCGGAAFALAARLGRCRGVRNARRTHADT